MRVEYAERSKDGIVPDNVVVTTRHAVGNATPILVTALVDVDEVFAVPNGHYELVLERHLRHEHAGGVAAAAEQHLFEADVRDCGREGSEGVTDQQVKTLYDTAKHCYDVMCSA